MILSPRGKQVRSFFVFPNIPPPPPLNPPPLLLNQWMIDAQFKFEGVTVQCFNKIVYCLSPKGNLALMFKVKGKFKMVPKLSHSLGIANFYADQFLKNL